MGVRGYLLTGDNTSNDSRERINAATPGVDTSQPIGITNNVTERLSKGEDLYNALLAKDYKESENFLKRQRAADFWGNVAKVFGQGVASTAGARQFTSIDNKTPHYNEQLSRLRQAYNGAIANQALTERRYELQNQQARDKMQLQYAKDAQLAMLNNQLKGGLIDKEQAYKIDNAIRKADSDKELAGVKHKYKLKEIDAQGKISKSIANMREDGANERARISAGGKGNETIVVTENGKTRAVTYPKEKKGAVISLYNRMRKIAEQRNDKSIPDLQLQFGEGGDQASKALTTIQNRLQDFPELTGEFYNIIGEGMDRYRVTSPKTKTPRLH